MTALPRFRYHPDPVATGSIEESDAVCLCCGEARGYIYTGPVYAADELDQSLCPWCIADGSAAERFDAEFTDYSGVGGWRQPNPLSDEVRREVATRTPGFSGWQQEQWLACCGDAAEFLGHAGLQELTKRWPNAIEAVRIDTGLEGAEWEGFKRALDKDHGPTAYVFRCTHCGRLLAYQDCD